MVAEDKTRHFESYPHARAVSTSFDFALRSLLAVPPPQRGAAGYPAEPENIRKMPSKLLNVKSYYTFHEAVPGSVNSMERRRH